MYRRTGPVLFGGGGVGLRSLARIVSPRPENKVVLPEYYFFFCPYGLRDHAVSLGDSRLRFVCPNIVFNACPKIKWFSCPKKAPNITLFFFGGGGGGSGKLPFEKIRGGGGCTSPPPPPAIVCFVCFFACPVSLHNRITFVFP